MAQVIGHECLDEVIAVIIAGLHAQIERLVRGGRGRCKLFDL